MRWLTSLLLLGLLSSLVQAEVVRLHFTPTDLCGHTSLYVGSDGRTGEWRAWGGAFKTEPYYCPIRPTHMVTFKHPHTCQCVKVPLKLGQGTPRLDYRRTAVVYSYDSYTITVTFLADGSVDVVYNSGLLRPLQ